MVDEIFRHLIRVKQYAFKREKKKRKGEWILVEKYKLQAEGLIYRIPVHKPTPEYLILKSDLTDKLRKELEESTSNEWRQDVLKQAVGRIFAGINFDYYHQSVAPLLKVRLV